MEKEFVLRGIPDSLRLDAWWMSASPEATRNELRQTEQRAISRPERSVITEIIELGGLRPAAAILCHELRTGSSLSDRVETAPGYPCIECWHDWGFPKWWVQRYLKAAVQAVLRWKGLGK